LSGQTYSTVRINRFVEEGQELIIDALNSKILLKVAENKYISVYDDLDKTANLDSFLYAKANTITKVVIGLNPLETGYLKASYRQFTL
jgi:hypothetical protein